MDEQLERIKRYYSSAESLHPDIQEDIQYLIQQAEKQVTKEVVVVMPGGGICPSCEVRLVGKANYCGKCGQKIGWGCYSNDG